MFVMQMLYLVRKHHTVHLIWVMLEFSQNFKSKCNTLDVRLSCSFLLARKFIVIPLRHHPNRDNIQVFSDSLEEFQYQDCRTHDSQEVYHAPSERLVKLRYYENKIVHFLRAALLKHWASSLIFYWCKIFGLNTLWH